MDWVVEESTLANGRTLLVVDPDSFYPFYFAEMKTWLTDARARQDPRRLELQLLYERATDAAEKKRRKAEFEVFKRDLYPVPDKMDQFWIECAFQFMKLDLQKEYGFNIEIRVQAHGGRKDRWALLKHPEGRGALQATNGKEARRFYKAMRGFIPG